MKRSLRSSIFILLLVMAGAAAAFSAEYPNHQNRLVNDFTGTLDAPSKERIEKILRDFEKKSSNEFVAVVVPDLQGEDVYTYAANLFKKWGIGKKGKDNGLLLLIATKERKWRFEVGYGLESVLTDAQSGRIGRNVLFPHLKNGQLGKGIENSLQEAMDIVVPPPPKILTQQEKARMAQQAKADHEAMLEKQRKEREKHEAFKQMVAFLLIGAFGIAVNVIAAVWVIRLLRNAREKKKMFASVRAGVLESMEAITASIKNHKANIKKFREMKYLGTPEFANAEVELKAVEFEEDLAEFSDEVREIKPLAELKKINDLYDCAEEVHELSIQSMNLEKSWQALAALPAKIRKQCEKAASQFVLLEQEVENGENLYLKMRKEGFRVEFDTEITICKEEVARLRNEMREAADSRKFSERIAKSLTAIASVCEKLSSIADTKARAEEKIASLPEAVQALAKESESAERTLMQLRAGHTEGIWKEVAQKFADFPNKIGAILALAASAKEKISMEVQQFDKALLEAVKAKDIEDEFKRLFLDIAEIRNDAEKAKSGYALAVSSAEESIRAAKKIVSNSDVDSSRKDNLKRIENELEGVKHTVSSSKMVDWIAVAATLMAMLEGLSRLGKLAKVDIEQAIAVRAAEKRNKEREEENRASRERANASASSARDDNDFNFGGGRSGGGGASGGY